MYKIKSRFTTRKAFIGIDMLQTGLMLALSFSFIAVSQDYAFEPRRKLIVDEPQGVIHDHLLPIYSTAHIYVSARQTPKYTSCHGFRPRIQINDHFVNLQGIRYALDKSLSCPTGHTCYPKAYLYVDSGVHMGVLDDIKKELRKRNWLIVVYVQGKDLVDAL